MGRRGRIHEHAHAFLPKSMSLLHARTCPCWRRRIGATDADHAEWNDAFWNDASRRVRGADHHHVWAYDDDDGDDDDDGGDDDNDDGDKMTRRIITTIIR